MRNVKKSVQKKKHVDEQAAMYAAPWPMAPSHPQANNPEPLTPFAPPAHPIDPSPPNTPCHHHRHHRQRGKKKCPGPSPARHFSLAAPHCTALHCIAHGTSHRIRIPPSPSKTHPVHIDEQSVEQKRRLTNKAGSNARANGNGDGDGDGGGDLRLASKPAHLT
ncbi:hypothetical protein BS50DRAFT_167768 [Corynespora cassiicola Philippines]|uniref:Uncharacterized protein n=1 Tax=Corynespora cassiicola Philippines TaxID=1448308 RepID=A0A2T2P511_CORCC|nr:hypothetical protein BS50DRAFT_167768 [Corynespora cassiicola Philippines]